VDLDKRIHSNQDTKALGKIAFVIMQTFINRKIKLGLIELREEHYDQMIQYNIVNEQYVPDVVQFEGKECPPMIEIPEYCKKYNLVESR